MPSTLDFLDPKLLWKVKGIGHLVESDKSNEPLIVVYFESFDRHSKGAKRYDYCHKYLQLSLFRKLSVGTEISNGKLVATRRRTWITVHPDDFIEHGASFYSEPKALVKVLKKQLHLYLETHQTKKISPPAFFPHASYLRIERNDYDIIIPCAELVRFYFCSSIRLTKSVFSPNLARWIEIYKDAKERYASTTPKWTDKERHTLDFIASDERIERAARLPFKHMMKTAIENHQCGFKIPPHILTRFPACQEMTLLVSYEALASGVRSLTKRRTYVVGTIYRSIESCAWQHQQDNKTSMPGAGVATYNFSRQRFRMPSS